MNETKAFRPIDGGYIFQPMQATFFHRPQAYRVDEAQKEEILATLQQGRGKWNRLLIRCVVALTIVASVWARAAGASFEHSILVGISIFLIGLLIAPTVAMRLALRPLRPLLANLPRSEELLFPRRPSGPAGSGAAASDHELGDAPEGDRDASSEERQRALLEQIRLHEVGTFRSLRS